MINKIRDYEGTARQIAQRLEEAVSRAGGRARVGGRAALPPNSLHEYLHGREMKLSVAMRLAAACEVSLHWLAFGGASMPESEPLEPQRADPQDAGVATLSLALTILDLNPPPDAAEREQLLVKIYATLSARSKGRL